MSSAHGSSARKRDTRARLIKAAIDVVARRGFHSASVSAIAKRAGYSIGALYWNFANKDELFLAVFDEHVSWFERQLRAALTAPEAGTGGTEWLELTTKRPQQFLVFVEFWAYAVRKPKMRKEFAERMRRMREATTQALNERARGLDVPPAIAPELAAVVGLALGRGLAIEKLADPDAVDDESVAQMLALLTV